MSSTPVVFEQIWVVSLKARPERLTQFYHQIDSIDWPFARPKVFPGIDATKVGLPSYWRGGPQDYGIHRAHVNLLERALQDDVRSLLIMEDGIALKPDASRTLHAFLDKVPPDWECLIFAGVPLDANTRAFDDQHLLESYGIRHTQFYGMRGRKAMSTLYKLWASAPIDGNFLLNSLFRTVKTYSPRHPCIEHVVSKNWQELHAFRLSRRNPMESPPIIVLDAPRELFEQMQDRGWHGGYRRDPETGIDCGLSEIFQNDSLDPHARLHEILNWINMIQFEAASIPNGICTIWHPAFKAETIRPLLRGNVYEVRANTASEALAQIPASLHPSHPLVF